MKVTLYVEIYVNATLGTRTMIGYFEPHSYTSDEPPIASFITRSLRDAMAVIADFTGELGYSTYVTHTIRRPTEMSLGPSAEHGPEEL